MKLQLYRVIRIGLKAVYHLFTNDGFMVAGTLAYTTLLSLFPFIIFLSSLTGLYGDTVTVQTIVAYFFALAPREVAQVLKPVIEEITQIREEGLVIVSMLATLWVTVSAMETFRTGLNRAYDVRETRSFLHRRLQDLLLVIGFTSSLIFASAIIVLGPTLFEAAIRWFGISAVLDPVWDVLRYISSFTVLTLTLSLIYLYLPNIEQRWKDILPGACIGALLWIALGSLFSLYLEHAKNYSITYGSLSGIIITLLFFQLSALIFLFGAEINQGIKSTYL